MSDEIQPVKALYYPRTHFSSTGWLKTALLYWEAVLRIVPEDVLLHDPPEVHALADEGLVENVPPERYQAGAKRCFLGHLEGAFKLDAEAPFPCGFGRESGRRQYKIFFIGKIERGLLKALQAHGLAAASAEWATMASEMTDLYLMGLANEIARDLHVAPSSNPPLEDNSATFLALQEAVGEPTPRVLVDGYACARTMGAFRLLEASDLPVPKLLRARQRYAQERHAFRELVQERVAAMAGLRSTHAVESHFRHLANELQNGAEAERRSRAATHWRNAWRVAGVVSPASIGGAVTVSGAPAIAAAIGGVGSVAAAITDWAVERRKVRHASSYLLSLETLGAGLHRTDQWTQLARFE